MRQTHMQTTGAAESVTVRIVEGVAEREGVEPVALTPPLHDVVDPEALESLFSDPISGVQREGIQVTFSYCGYTVSVAGRGEVTVRTE